MLRMMYYRMMKRKPIYDTPIRIICALLFATFSFLYIYMLQGEQLALVQDHLAQGKTSNNTFITALLITLLLGGLQYLLNRVGELHGKFEALSYLPSCVLLALITKVDNTFAYSWKQWVVALVVVAVIYLLGVWLSKNTYESRDTKLMQQLPLNLGVLTAMFVFTGWYGNNANAAQLELAAWKHTHAERYDKVLEVGMQCDEYNADLTALRNLALAKTGQMGTKLFAYPQPYGSAGLMMNRYNVQTPSYGANKFYDALGTHPYGGESAEAFYHRMLVKTDSLIYRDMYLSALLLDKNLKAFTTYITRNQQDGQPLADIPVHYQEALMIYNEQHPFTPVAFVPDEAVVQRYHDYLTLRETYALDPIALQNLSKRQFGNTYWYYYDFVE